MSSEHYCKLKIANHEEHEEHEGNPCVAQVLNCS